MRRAGIYVPGGRAPYPSTVVMGVVTARVAGVLGRRRVRSARGPPARSTRRCSPRAGWPAPRRVYAMGGAQAVAALAYGTETVSAGRRDRRPGQPVRPGGQAPGVGRRRDRRLRGAERPVRDRGGGRATCTSRGARPARPGRARPRHARGRGVAGRERCSTNCRSASTDGRGHRRDCTARRCVRTPGRRSRSPGVRARAPRSWSGPTPRRSRRGSRAPAACSSAPRRRPRSATTSPARTTSCRPTAPRASPRACRRRTSAGASARCGSVTTPASSPALAAPIARAEGFELHARSMEARIRDNGPR